MVGTTHVSDRYFDLSPLTQQQHAVMAATLTALLNSPTFVALAESSLKQYGRVRITMNAAEATASSLATNPPQFNINPAQVEQSGYVLPDGTPAPLTIHRVVAHEVAHFAQDKHEAKELMRRRLATMVQGALARGFSLDRLAQQVQQIYPHYITFFGYENAQTLLKDVMQLQPISQSEYIRLTEEHAMRADNHVMHELYGEAVREATARAYVLDVLQQNRVFRCAIDTVRIVDESHQGDSEPCAYARIPGQQRSLIPEM